MFDHFTPMDWSIVGGILAGAIGACGAMLWMIHDEFKRRDRRKEHWLWAEQLRIDRRVCVILQQKAMEVENGGRRETPGSATPDQPYEYGPRPKKKPVPVG